MKCCIRGKLEEMLTSGSLKYAFVLLLIRPFENLLAGVLVFFLVFHGDGLVDEGLCFLELPLFHEDPCEIVQQIGVVTFDPETFTQSPFRQIELVLPVIEVSQVQVRQLRLLLCCKDTQKFIFGIMPMILMKALIDPRE